MPLVYPIITATLLLSAARGSVGQEPLATCGGCWCVTEGGNNCPSTVANGVFTAYQTDGFASLVLKDGGTNAEAVLPKLLSSNGGECFPLSHLGIIEKYPKSQLPECEFPAMSEQDGAVCGFTFNNEGDACDGNTYGMKSFASSAAATNAGATVTHEGACGVCSSAQDLAVMGGKSLDISQKFTSCGTAYYTQVQVLSKDPNTSFDKLVQCVQQLGYTNDCGVMWAHQVAVSGSLCVNECIAGGPLFGEPPACAFGDCMTCTADKAGAALDKLAGRTNVNSGIRETVIRSCGDFASIVHDPQCSVSGAPSAPTPATPGATSTYSAGTTAGPHQLYILVLLVGLMMRF